jgi:hypothetical protein
MSSIHIYKGNSGKLNGLVYVTYTGGFFTGLKLEMKQAITTAQFTYLMAMLPYIESDLQPAYGSMLMTRVEDDSMSKYEKIAMFCEFYKYHRKVNYKAQKEDGGRIGNFKISGELLEVYFKSTEFIFHNKWSIPNLCKYYNELIAEAGKINKPALKITFPNGYSSGFEAECSPYEKFMYHKHLRALGWTSERDKSQVNWYPPQTNG